MKPQYTTALDDCARELDDIHKYYKKNPTDKYNKYLIRYAVIKASGTIERVFKGIVVDKVSQGALPETRNYFNETIQKSGRNPSYANITTLLTQFGRNWADTFKSKVQARHRESLDSLVKLRNAFAHGRDITCSPVDVINNFQSGRTILECLDVTLNPP